MGTLNVLVNSQLSVQSKCNNRIWKAVLLAFFIVLQRDNAMHEGIVSGPNMLLFYILI